MSRELTAEEIELLRSTPAPEERHDLVCPDCGAPLKLKAGKFGRFYGCSKWEETQCKGSHGAHLDTGAPYGVPVNARIRELRKRIMQTLEELPDSQYRLVAEGEMNLPEGSPSVWGETECIQALRALKGPVFKWDLLNLDSDFLPDDPAAGC